jgi:hypothetical protein
VQIPSSPLHFGFGRSVLYDSYYLNSAVAEFQFNDSAVAEFGRANSTHFQPWLNSSVRLVTAARQRHPFSFENYTKLSTFTERSWYCMTQFAMRSLPVVAIRFIRSRVPYVALIARSIERLEETKAEINVPAPVLTYTVDLSSLEDLNRSIEAARGKLRQVRFRCRGGGGCTVEETVSATEGREVVVLCVCLC